MNYLHFFKEEKGLSVEIKCIYSGKDINIILTGGDSPHIGAIALGVYTDMESIVNSITAPEHKETELAIKVAEKISNIKKVNVSVSCGIHKDNIALDEIKLFLQLADNLVDELLEEI